MSKPVRIQHCIWRGGRPRFVPGPRLRALGHVGQDLRHGQGGAWFSAAEARGWIAAQLTPAAAQLTPAAPARPPAPRALTIGGLIEAWLAHKQRFADAAAAPGGKRRRRRPLAPATFVGYRQKARVIAEVDGVAWCAPAAALRPHHALKLFEKIEEQRGLATAAGCNATLRAAYSWGLLHGRLAGLAVNPCKGLNQPTPEPRVRAGTPDEMRHLIATATAMGRADVAAAIVMGLWTAQRQKDRLALVDGPPIDGRRVFRQSKTRAIAAIPDSPELSACLAALRERRRSWPVQPLHVLVDETARQPWKADWYRHVFARVRDAAAAAMPSLTGFRDQDLRDTAVTWLARAECTVIEIAQITGHRLESVHQILRHYLAAHPEIADNAIRKQVEWWEKQA